jgi:hypothetical protein
VYAGRPAAGAGRGGGRKTQRHDHDRLAHGTPPGLTAPAKLTKSGRARRLWFAQVLVLSAQWLW